MGCLHYRLDGGDDVNVDDFLRTYDLPRPGASALLPADLRDTLPGAEPDEAALVPEGGQRQIFVVRSGGGPLLRAGDVYVRVEG